MNADALGIQFVEPQWLLALAAPGVLLLLWIWQLWRRGATIRAFRRARRVSIAFASEAAHTPIERIPRFGDLLFWLSAAMHREDVTIDLAKINTEGERVADVFYVTNRDGSKLDPDQVERVERRIGATLAMIEGDPEKS